MTTTLHHTPSSLPSDYGLIARYAAHTTNGPEQEITESAGSGAEDVADYSSTRGPHHTHGRRESMSNSVSGHRPLAFSSAMPDTHAPAPATFLSETTPLLIPRITEEEDGSSTSANEDDEDPISMFWKEITVLARYTLPIFGYVFCSLEVH